MKRKKTHPALRFQRQVLAFSVLAVLLLATSIFLSSARTEIRLRPIVSREPVERVFRLGTGELAGLVLQETLETSVDVVDLPAASEEKGYAIGTVTITNTWTRPQPLQEGTRLMSESGVLFRTQERVDVPAHGTVSAAVKADQPGPSGDIGPSTFEIVALWEGLKKDIVAASKTKFTGGVAHVSRLDETTLTAAKKEALATLEKQAKARMQETLKNGNASSFTLLDVQLTVLEETPSANVGEVISRLTVTTKVKATGIATDVREVETALLEDAQQNAAVGTAVQGLRKENRSITVQRADVMTQTAEFTVTDDALVTVTNTHPLFDRSRLIGRSRQELTSYFDQFPTVKLLDVRFSPFWSQSASRLQNNISITILEPEYGTLETQ